MLNIFAVMCLGALAGWLTRRWPHPRRAAGVATTTSILLLMILLGAEVGGNDYVLYNLGSIGIVALLLGLGAVGGVLIAAKLLWKYSFHQVAPRPTDTVEPVSAEEESKGGNRFSLLVVGIFTGGIALGIFTPLAAFLAEYRPTMWALYLLMLAVGITIGSDTATLRGIVQQPKRSLLVPLASILGTWAGVTLIWIAIRSLGLMPLPWPDAMAVGSGLGYYSLSGVLLGELRGAEIGTIALLANITREMATVIGTPWMVRRFSPLAPICAGGATTLDVSLPGIIRHCGPQYLALAVFQGVIADLSVPLMIPFFAEWAG